jgi:hypothetical protein
VELLAAAGVRDHLAERPLRACSRGLGNERAVEADVAVEVAPARQDFIGGDEHVRYGTGEVLRLLRAKAGRHLVKLHIARGKIVEHDEAPDRCFARIGIRIEQWLGQHEAEFQLIVDGSRVRRNCNRIAVRRDREVIAHVVQRLAIPEAMRFQFWKRAAREPLIPGDDAGGCRHEGAHEAARRCDRVRLIEHEVAKRGGLEWDNDIAVVRRLGLKTLRHLGNPGADIRGRRDERDGIACPGIHRQSGWKLQAGQGLGDRDPSILGCEFEVQVSSAPYAPDLHWPHPPQVVRICLTGFSPWEQSYV